MTEKTRDIVEFKNGACSIIKSLEEIKEQIQQGKLKGKSAIQKMVMPNWKEFSMLKVNYAHIANDCEFYEYCKKIKKEFENFKEEVPFLKVALKTKSDF